MTAPVNVRLSLSPFELVDKMPAPVFPVEVSEEKVRLVLTPIRLNPPLLAANVPVLLRVVIAPNVVFVVPYKATPEAPFVFAVTAPNVEFRKPQPRYTPCKVFELAVIAALTE